MQTNYDKRGYLNLAGPPAKEKKTREGFTTKRVKWQDLKKGDRIIPDNAECRQFKEFAGTQKGYFEDLICLIFTDGTKNQIMRDATVVMEVKDE